MIETMDADNPQDLFLSAQQLLKDVENDAREKQEKRRQASVTHIKNVVRRALAKDPQAKHVDVKDEWIWSDDTSSFFDLLDDKTEIGLVIQTLISQGFSIGRVVHGHWFWKRHLLRVSGWVSPQKALGPYR